MKTLALAFALALLSGCTFRTVGYNGVRYVHRSFGVKQSIGELRVKEGDVEVVIRGFSNDQAEVIGLAVEKAVSAAVKSVAP